MITTLENLTETVKENTFNELAKWIIQYSKFKIKSVMKFAPSGYSASTLDLYRRLAERYFNENKKERYYDNLYTALDVQSKKYQPLTPSAMDRKMIYVRKTKSYLKAVQPLIAKLDIVNQPVCAKIKYGIQFDDTVLLFDKEDFARYFNKGLEYANWQAGKIVTVELGEV